MDIQGAMLPLFETMDFLQNKQHVNRILASIMSIEEECSATENKFGIYESKLAIYEKNVI